MSTPRLRRGLDRAVRSSCCAPRIPVQLRAPGGARSVLPMVRFVWVFPFWFFSLILPIQPNTRPPHTHTAYCFHLFLTGLDVKLRGVVFCGRFMRPPGSQANISNDFAQNTQLQRHFDKTAAAAGEKHDTIDIQDVGNEVGACVLACPSL